MSERRTVKFYQADVFTDTVFGGNPVAVVPDAGSLDAWEMQKIAREMNLFEVAKAISVPKTQITGTGLPVEVVSTGFPVMIVPVRTLTAVSKASPNIGLLNSVCEQHKAQGLMLFTTVTVEEQSTVHTRMFASPVGVLEDPATGSASGALGAYLVKHGVVDVGPTTEIICEQGYEIDRPSRL